MSMGERIKEKRLEMGYTQEELAEKLGLKKSAIAKYENGRVENIKRSIIAKMAKILECSPSYLMEWDTDTNADADLIQVNNIHKIELKKLPMLGEIACGEPRYANEDRESYVLAGSDIKADCCLTARGDSMIGARIHDGDIVFIRRQDIVENGEIAAVVVNNDSEATLKRFYYYKEEAILILKPENPKFKDQIYRGEQLNEVHVIGKAIAFQSDVI